MGVCTLDESERCVGCLRTADEIARWIDLSEAERERILIELPGRAARHGAG